MHHIFENNDIYGSVKIILPVMLKIIPSAIFLNVNPHNPDQVIMTQLKTELL